MESIVSDTFESSARYIRDQIEDVIAGRAKKTKHDPAYRVATLTRMLSQVAAEQRKTVAAKNKQLEKITRPLVLAWARTLDKEERRSIAREIAAMDQEGSLLA
jgi:hypothetical protein